MGKVPNEKPSHKSVWRRFRQVTSGGLDNLKKVSQGMLARLEPYPLAWASALQVCRKRYLLACR